MAERRQNDSDIGNEPPVKMTQTESSMIDGTQSALASGASDELDAQQSALAPLLGLSNVGSSLSSSQVITSNHQILSPSNGSNRTTDSSSNTYETTTQVIVTHGTDIGAFATTNAGQQSTRSDGLHRSSYVPASGIESLLRASNHMQNPGLVDNRPKGFVGVSSSHPGVERFVSNAAHQPHLSVTDAVNGLQSISTGLIYSNVPFNNAALYNMSAPHLRSNCKAKAGCDRCDRRHHSLLHFIPKERDNKKPRDPLTNPTAAGGTSGDIIVIQPEGGPRA
ncbi:hypothetical protein QAD02_008112 [Eretmocerus hayati]|uniref:Uncharacterized protein n=1 Tax=Eretmocerus hayati TaxID=131215 RepID=A0ACC2N9W4_9HYME|nr:hypothetical protein QAD02_008112 [Eretmocerus hayati]